MPRSPSPPWIDLRTPRRAWSLGIGLALALGAGVVRADECSNPCEVNDGDMCVSTLRVVELGRSIAMGVGRQRGMCGDIAPMAATDLVLTWSRDPSGPFTPVPVTRRGGSLLVKPDRAGPYFIEAAARDGAGAPDRLVIMVVDPKTAAVALRLRPSKGLAVANTAIKVWWVPTGGLDRFPRRRWPVWRDNDASRPAERRMRLPSGRYDVEWTNRKGGHARTGVTTIDVTGPGPFDVALTAAEKPARPPR
ncbi:MAG TPA: hypothetical protein VFK02_33515 [Kofleriaceae bacterium]|nr:hypothetical protein [Kofleriaceae bacterium]